MSVFQHNCRYRQVPNLSSRELKIGTPPGGLSLAPGELEFGTYLARYMVPNLSLKLKIGTFIFFRKKKTVATHLAPGFHHVTVSLLNGLTVYRFTPPFTHATHVSIARSRAQHSEQPASRLDTPWPAQKISENFFRPGG